jgi:hypothetical protein
MPPIIEALESRELLSAAAIKHVHKRHHAKHAPPALQALDLPARAVSRTTQPATQPVAPPAAIPTAWNDLAGDWTGTFSNNLSPSGTISAQFANRWGASNTGTFDLSALIGQSNCITTTTPDVYGNLLITVPVQGGIVSFVAGISYDGQNITGRWCTHIGSSFVTGLFSMHRV